MKIRTASKPPASVLWDVMTSGERKFAVGLTEKGEICRLSYLKGRKIGVVLERWRAQWPDTVFSKGADLTDFEHKPVLLVGTPFQQAVWKAIARIPHGQVRSYGEVARALGKPFAARAVGGACGANPVPFLVPCHRVVASQGLGGFSGGLDIKKALLEEEQQKTPFA